MKKLMLPFLAMGVMTLGIQACETQGGDSDVTDTFTPTDTVGTDTVGTDTTVVTTQYYAIFLEDLSEHRCATSSSGAHGSDIDAVALWDGSTLIGYFDSIDAERDDADCTTHGFTDTAEAKGAPQANPKLTEGFYSLGFGWLIGEFDNVAEILSGYDVTVYEIDDDACLAAGIPLNQCVGSEPYAVSIATGLDCVNENDPNACMMLISDQAEGTATLPLSGF